MSEDSQRNPMEEDPSDKTSTVADFEEPMTCGSRGERSPHTPDDDYDPHRKSKSSSVVIRDVDMTSPQNGYPDNRRTSISSDGETDASNDAGDCMVFNIKLGNDPYTEVSALDLIKKERKLRKFLNPFGHQPKDRVDGLVDVIKQRSYYSSTKRRYDDWLAENLGDGYDKDDPFIDDSEAIDEVIGINTKHGGFYVCNGDVEVVESGAILNPMTATEQEEELAVLQSVGGLPDGVQPTLRQTIEEFVDHSKQCQEDTNTWHSQRGTELLLKIDTECGPSTNFQQRGQIYSYISGELQVQRSELFGHIRKTKCGDSGLKSSLAKLRAYVCTKIVEIEKRVTTLEKSNAGDEQQQQQTASKQRFQWCTAGRRLLQRVSSIRLEQCPDNCKDVHHWLRIFLDTEVKGFWPKGWMTLSALMRESRALLPKPNQQQNFTTVVAARPRKSQKNETSEADSDLTNRITLSGVSCVADEAKTVKKMFSAKNEMGVVECNSEPQVRQLAAESAEHAMDPSTCRVNGRKLLDFAATGNQGCARSLGISKISGKRNNRVWFNGKKAGNVIENSLTGLRATEIGKELTNLQPSLSRPSTKHAPCQYNNGQNPCKPKISVNVVPAFKSSIATDQTIPSATNPKSVSSLVKKRAMPSTSIPEATGSLFVNQTVPITGTHHEAAESLAGQRTVHRTVTSKTVSPQYKHITPLRPAENKPIPSLATHEASSSSPAKQLAKPDIAPEKAYSSVVENKAIPSLATHEASSSSLAEQLAKPGIAPAKEYSSVIENEAIPSLAAHEAISSSLADQLAKPVIAPAKAYSLVIENEAVPSLATNGAASSLAEQLAKPGIAPAKARILVVENKAIPSSATHEAASSLVEKQTISANPLSNIESVSDICRRLSSQSPRQRTTSGYPVHSETASVRPRAERRSMSKPYFRLVTNDQHNGTGRKVHKTTESQSGKGCAIPNTSNRLTAHNKGSDHQGAVEPRMPSANHHRQHIGSLTTHSSSAHLTMTSIFYPPFVSYPSAPSNGCFYTSTFGHHTTPPERTRENLGYKGGYNLNHSDKLLNHHCHATNEPRHRQQQQQQQRLSAPPLKQKSKLLSSSSSAAMKPSASSSSSTQQCRSEHPDQAVTGANPTQPCNRH